MKKRTGTFFKVLILIFVLVLAFCGSLFFGAEKPTLFLIRYLRLPRSVLVLLSGALLAGSGAVFQLFFRNPLAEPGLLGISSGATLGAVSSACLGGFSFLDGFVSSINIAAFLGAFLSGLVLAFISSSGKRVTSVVLLLCGTALGTFYSSVSSMIMLMHNKELYGIYSWLLGSFNGRGLNELKFVIIPAVLAFVLMALILNPLDLLNGGEENARNLGVNVSLLRLLVIGEGSLAVSVAVCAGGTISFVGLVAPHIMRRIFSSKSKTLVWTSALGGATLLLAADTIARIVMKPGELPCGIITSFIGVPFFIMLIFQKKGGRNE
ncbi:MAG: iron ABC transporter permease [Treponema sp.]|nr:iron ABC transporter permease [Treponema sp.]